MSPRKSIVPSFDRGVNTRWETRRSAISGSEGGLHRARNGEKPRDDLDDERRRPVSRIGGRSEDDERSVISEGSMSSALTMCPDEVLMGVVGRDGTSTSIFVATVEWASKNEVNLRL